MARAGRPSDPHSRLKDAPGSESDARIGSWPHERLVQMDQRFVERVTRAIERGEERPPSETAYASSSLDR